MQCIYRKLNTYCTKDSSCFLHFYRPFSFSQKRIRFFFLTLYINIFSSEQYFTYTHSVRFISFSDINEIMDLKKFLPYILLVCFLFETVYYLSYSCSFYLWIVWFFFFLQEFVGKLDTCSTLIQYKQVNRQNNAWECNKKYYDFILFGAKNSYTFSALKLCIAIDL